MPKFVIKNDINDIVKLLCDFLKTDYGTLLSKRRDYDIVMKRIIISKYLLYHFHYTTEMVGKALKRNHSTIVYYNGLYENEYKFNSEFRKLADSIMKKEKEE